MLVQNLNAVAGVSASFQDGRLNITGTSGSLEMKARVDSTGTDSAGKEAIKKLFGTDSILLEHKDRKVQSNVVSSRPNSGELHITSPDGTLKVVNLADSDAETKLWMQFMTLLEPV